MNASSPPVAEYVTPAPYAVGPNEPLDNARRLMDKYGIRVLPVRAEGRFVGSLSGRDLRLVWALARSTPEPLTVASAMTAEPLVVSAGTALADVVRAMAARELDAAIVVGEGGSTLGVFTSADALRALVEALEGKLARGDERAKTHPRRSPRGRPAR